MSKRYNIVAENNHFRLYKIDTFEQALAFNGQCYWSICNNKRDIAKYNFDIIANFTKNAFYAYVRKNIVNLKDPWNYILELRDCTDCHTYVKTKLYYEDAFGVEHDTIPNWVEPFPKYDKEPAELIIKEELTLEENLEAHGFKLDENDEWNGDGDIYANVIKGLIKYGRLTVKFGRVGGSFRCSNTWLTTLEGCPREVGKDFFCSGLQIKTLKGAPEKCVGFYCNDCEELIDLNGAPKKCYSIDCVRCKNLTSLEGAPEKVINFNCSSCENLVSLNGAPKFCRNFTCSNCYNLTNLNGLPESLEFLNYMNCPNLRSDYKGNSMIIYK